MGTALGYTIRELRKEKGISQRELAEAIGMRANAINNYENGYRTPDANIVLQLAKFFSVSSDYLLGITPSRNSFSWIETSEQADKISELLKGIRPDIRNRFLPALEDFILDGTETESYAIVLDWLTNIMVDLKKAKSIYANIVVDYATSCNSERDLLYLSRLNSDLADICLDIIPEVTTLRKELCKLFLRDMKAVQAQQKLMTYGDTIPRQQLPEDTTSNAEE